EADVTTGFLFNGRRLHRKSNPLTVKVKPLSAGAPAGFSPGNVGKLRLSIETTSTHVSLGEPLTVKVNVEGRGNLKNVTPPPLPAPPSFKVYDPTTTDKNTVQNGKLVGHRTQEYLVLPQQTGEFTVPGMELVFFDPESGQ